jgi:hypothetical protein
MSIEALSRPELGVSRLCKSTLVPGPKYCLDHRKVFVQAPGTSRLFSTARIFNRSRGDTYGLFTLGAKAATIGSRQ